MLHSSLETNNNWHFPHFHSTSFSAFSLSNEAHVTHTWRFQALRDIEVVSRDEQQLAYSSLSFLWFSVFSLCEKAYMTHR